MQKQKGDVAKAKLNALWTKVVKDERYRIEKRRTTPPGRSRVRLWWIAVKTLKHSDGTDCDVFRMLGGTQQEAAREIRRIALEKKALDHSLLRSPNAPRRAPHRVGDHL